MINNIEFTDNDMKTSGKRELPPLCYEDLLRTYGPEGCYEIANALISIADKDISDSYLNFDS